LLHFTAAPVCLSLTLNRQWHNRPGMSDTGFVLPGVTEPPHRYSGTVAVDTGGDHLPNPAEFAIAASAQHQLGPPAS